MHHIKNLGLVALLATAFVLASMPTQADAHPRNGGPFGLGVILGDPTGLTGKVFITDTQAIDFHLGFDNVYRGREDFGLYADYLFHIDVGLNPSWASIPLYVGPGIGLIFWDDDRYCNKFGCYDTNDDVAFQIRVPIGMSFLFSKFAGEAFAELVPGIFFIPEVDFDFDGAIGFRYYF